MFVSIYSMFTDSSSKEKELDATAFYTLLTNKEEASKIEKIQVDATVVGGKVVFENQNQNQNQK
jgi:hypothetical protein